MKPLPKTKFKPKPKSKKLLKPQKYTRITTTNSKLEDSFQSYANLPFKKRAKRSCRYSLALISKSRRNTVPPFFILVEGTFSNSEFAKNSTKNETEMISVSEETASIWSSQIILMNFLRKIQ